MGRREPQTQDIAEDTGFAESFAEAVAAIPDGTPPEGEPETPTSPPPSEQEDAGVTPRNPIAERAYQEPLRKPHVKHTNAARKQLEASLGYALERRADLNKSIRDLEEERVDVLIEIAGYETALGYFNDAQKANS